MSKVSGFFVLALLPLILTVAAPPAVAAPPPDDTHQAVSEKFGRLPLAFEANSGQLASAAKFLARGADFALALTPTSMQLQLAGSEANAMAILRTELVGAAASAQMSGEIPLPGQSTYISGADRQAWRSNVAQYARVRSTAVYPGIDVVYYGNAGEVEYDFVVAPKADPQRIRMRLSGMGKLALNSAGDLLIHTAVGELVQHQPVAYQEIGGRRTPVAAAYRLKNSELSVALGAYDHNLTLVIDPLLTYRIYVPAIQHEFATAIAVDGAGNAYITGQALPYDVFNIAGAKGMQLLGNADVFVAKLNSAGTALSYIIYIGGTDNEAATAIAVDPSGNAYIGGYTRSIDFPVLNALQGSKAALVDGFVAKINAAGNNLVYSTYLGGVGNDQIFGLALGANGGVAVTGTTDSIDFPVTSGAYQPQRSVRTDAFVSRLNPNGSLAWSTYLGGSDTDYVGSIAMDPNGDVYIAGSTFSLDFPVTPGVVQAVHAPPHTYICGTSTCSTFYADAFISKLSGNGAQLLYSTFLGDDMTDVITSLAVDSTGSAYAAGYTESPAFPITMTFPAGGRAFLTKLNADASALLYSSRFGGSDYTYPTAIALEGTSAVVAGYTYSQDYPTRLPIQRANSGQGDFFISKFAPSGASLVFSSFLGQSRRDEAHGLALDSAGNVYVTGVTSSTNFPVTPAVTQGASIGRGDPVAVKIKADGSALAYSTYFGMTNIYAKLAFTGNGTGAQTGPTLSLPVPLRGIIGCTVRALDGAVVAGTNILFPNADPCGKPAPPP